MAYLLICMYEKYPVQFIYILCGSRLVYSVQLVVSYGFL